MTFIFLIIILLFSLILFCAQKRLRLGARLRLAGILELTLRSDGTEVKQGTFPNDDDGLSILMFYVPQPVNHFMDGRGCVAQGQIASTSCKPILAD